MQIISSPQSIQRTFMVDGGGSDIVEGAVVMVGVTDETNTGCVIVGSGACANAVGLISHLHDFSVSGDTTMEDGAIRVMASVSMFMPGCLVAAEIDNDTQLDVTAYTAGTKKIRVASLEDDIDGGWVYVADGPGAGELQYVIADDGTDLTLKTALTTAATTDTDIIILRPELHQLHTLSSNASKIITSAAAGSLTWCCIGIEFKYDGMERWERLDFTKHSGMTGLDSLNVKFRYIMIPSSTIFPG